jgi:hypothetical protein
MKLKNACGMLAFNLVVDADDHLIKAADYSLTSACPINGLVAA